MKLFKGKLFILTMIFLLLANSLLPLSTIVTADFLQEGEAEEFTLSIIHTNDTHAHVERYPSLFTAVKELRNKKENSILVDAGDVFSGTLYFRQYLGLADLYFMNLLGYDAMTFGNHEFDKDSATLANFVKNMNFPMVSSNVNVTDDADLSPFFKHEIGNPATGGNIYPAIIKEFNGEKVGIFGLTTEDTKFLASPGENVVFEDAIERSTETVAMLKAEGINKIVVLSHLGYTPDVQLAEMVDGIDVIVGGHSHIKLDAPVVVAKDEPTVIVQAGEYLNFLGLLDVTFDSEGVITHHNGQLLNLNNYEEDADAKAKVLEFKEPLDELVKEVVGQSSLALNGVRADVRTKETNLGNLITDSMVAKANESVKTHIAIQNGGGIRDSIPAGDITLGQVLTVMPFGNNLVTIDLTGQELWKTLEHGVSGVETAEGKFLQVSGINFKYDLEKPVGQRVWSVEVKTDSGYENLDLSKTYTVATNAFIADGGDGYSMLKKAKDAGKMKELFFVDFEILVSYLEKNSPVSPEVEGRIIQETRPHELVIMGTTDIHAHIMPYDYMEDSVNENFGLAKVYTLVQQIRQLYPNTLLVDNGDIIQGSIFGDIEAVVDPRKEGETHSIIASMNMMGYDAGTVGNHEFNFGLPFLDGIVGESNFPWLSANTYNVSGEHRYDPYVILDRKVDGKPIKIGVIGFVPPQVMIWDKKHLNDNIYVDEIVETAKKYIPEMKEKGADVIVVASHSGFDISDDASENASYQLSQIEGINALITGHQHYVFPSSRYESLPGADIAKGTLNGVPTVMPGAWGDHLGVIKLQLVQEDGEWTVVSGNAQAILTKGFKADGDMVALTKDRHEQTIEYVNTPVGETATELNTYFSRVATNKVVQLINDAQLEFGAKYFAGTDYESMPLLSAAAPFKAGRNGVSYYTNVKDGIAIKDIADIYIYPNTLQVVKIDGKDLLKWLEVNANNFNQIDPQKTEDQVLLDYSFRGFNFDTIAGIEYQIDVTKPKGQRIVKATYNGTPITNNMEFLVVTNNYRASGGGDHILNAPSAEVVYSATEENREVLIDYVRTRGTIDVQLENNWSIVPVKTKGNVIFRSSPEGKDYIEKANLEYVTYYGEGTDGWALYKYNFEKEFTPPVVSNPAPTPGEKVIVNNPIGVEGKIPVTIGRGTKQVLLPAHAAAIDGKNALSIVGEDLSVEIPGMVLKQLKDLAKSNENILFSFNKIDKKTVTTILNSISKKDNANITNAGEIFDFTLAVVDKDGKQTKVSTFSQPITITLPVTLTTNKDLIGVYNIKEDGTLEYVGGKYKDGKIVAQLTHFSKYAVLEYNKEFADVQEGYWAYDVIKQMTAKHIAQGINSNNFAPKRDVTRAEFVSLIVRALGLTPQEGVVVFTDVDPTKWYASAIKTASETGIVTGKSATHFAPEETITREEMAVIVVRAYEYATNEKVTLVKDEATFADMANSSSWSKEYISKAAKLELLQGRGNNLFVPAGLTQRAESIQVIANLLNHLN